MSLQLFDEIEVRRALHRACVNAGSQRAFAQQVGVSDAYISDVLCGYREPSRRICKVLGFVPVRRWMKT